MALKNVDTKLLILNWMDGHGDGIGDVYDEREKKKNKYK